jgi:hypothetical protein
MIDRETKETEMDIMLGVVILAIVRLLIPAGLFLLIGSLIHQRQSAQY